ncbi:MAG: sodium-translocating pyrophosphatase [Actinobacteria bacterium]|jgi:K(+)-stimulated pyrophosphate-energized sodium pump|nr:sodium-translocating pyrophosphatase [Actinomycetota bacterium]MBT5655913.1 sodium-translocating pyrophosphatase [Actinomycetota bacterium]MBT7013794.1 sodium-translocating pyrophosphatase [Actinomycetota bacterium]MDA9602079.1 sodium-translocating pyrophosphatase [Candidatus Actinomarina sp.]MDA9686410.1 sodium-translocating pyrophosphatase [bacterium]
MLINSMIAAVAGLALAGFFANKVLSIKVTDSKVEELSTAIREGSMAFLKRMYSWISVFVVILAVLISVLTDWGYPWGSFAFVAGAVLSSLAGFIGMRIATAANGRTTEAARDGGTIKALPVAFRGGAVMGFTVAGLGLLGVSLGYWLFIEVLELPNGYDVLAAIGLGGSSIALFARVGGGIYTKAADVGADLVGKVEAGIPEDDPRNPATIADNVGDNVGDVAGMGADLFESYVGSLVAPLAYAAIVFAGQSVLPSLLLFPLAVGTIGMGASILSSFLVVPKEGKLAQALHRGTYSAAILTVIGVYFLSDYMFADYAPNPIGLFFSVIIGLAVGLLVGQISEWFTSDHFSIVKNIADQAKTGPATLVLSGISEGMRSAAYSVIVVVFGIYGAYTAGNWALDEGGGIYGIAIAAIGVLSTLGITVAVDAYGPIADNAGGIAEMAHLPPEVREATDELDSLGNTTAAIAKGFAIASAAVTALALFSAFVKSAGIEKLDITEVEVTMGLFLGGMFPFLFAAMTINAVGRAAFKMIEEVRRQFNEIPGLREGKEGVVPDYTKCVDIATTAALKEMLLPGGLAIALPLIIGFWDKEALGGFLAGSLVTGFLLAIFMANSGGAWDNAKKYIEAGGGAGKGSDEHKAAVIGDTIGDPFKDTSGPAMNIVIKVMTIVSLIFASAF